MMGILGVCRVDVMDSKSASPVSPAAIEQEKAAETS